MNYDLKSLEDYRLKVINKTKKFVYIGIPFFIIAIILFICAFVLDNAPDFIIILGALSFVIAFSCLGISTSQRKKANNEIKSKLIVGLLEEHCGKNVIYQMNSTLPQLEEIVRLGLVERPDRIEGGDYYSAVYNGVRFAGSDITLQERIETTDSEGKKQVRYDDYFKGRMIVFDLERLPQNMCFIEKGSHVRRISGLEKVQTEISLLNEKYRIEVENKEEIFHYLTPVVLKGFIDFEEQVGGKISYVFYNNKLYLFIEGCPDSLEIKMSKAIDEAQINYILGGLRLPLDIIDSLKLNDDFFKRKENK